jgi:hypothetical protein
MARRSVRKSLNNLLRRKSRRASKRRSSRRSSRRASKLTSLKDIQNIAIKHHVVYKGKSKNKLTETLCNVTGARHPSNNRRGMTKKEMLMIGPYISNKKLINIVNCKKAYQKLIK